ncbi:Fe3+-hydroxamate ABC transporter substrate-binding protein [Halorubrum sp. SD626R]|uniref:ABC transporter substrate-binding protein n=1 Tax=Halorubrum sp. SD626R TaxID=1419722 RepID=UPI0010FA2A60|nr:ABC transporter substrate-binding protein [Halorubrum sp. SD626R]TKX77127.1 Fe3+-hydroxamate ABC transporter substrate-binding protein [Halorubrum sp. SD626R]
MSSDRISRRDVLTTGAGALTASIAGCATGSGNRGGGDGADGGSSEVTHAVSMEPVGEVAFRGVPERWLTYFPGYADMGVALGHGDGLVAVGNVPRYHVDAYDELPGVSVDTDDLTQVLGEGGIDTEIYYELDADVHLTDPQWLINNSAFGLEPDAVDEIASNVGPFLGNTVFRRTDGWHKYRYYTLYEAFETVAEVFQERERYEEFRAFHDDVIAGVRADLPPADRRPNALLTFGNGDEPERFSPYRLSDGGTNKKQFRDLGLTDALADTGISGLSTTDRGRIDYETMLEVNPDVILVRGHEDKTADEFADTVFAFMRNHDVASELSAVRNGRVFRGGPIYQGPVQHLFSLERAATEIFPDTFSGELFDRDELAAIVTEES